MKHANLEIVYEDDVIIVVNKQEHLASQGGAGVRTHLLTLLTDRLGEPPHLLHRLDKETSGIILAVKASVPRRELAGIYDSFQQAKKSYRLLVRGRMKGKQFFYERTQYHEGKQKKTQTQYNVLKNFAKYSYLEATLITGREHQIRRDMSALEHPILGDEKYGDFALNKTLKQLTGIQTLYLIAYKIAWENKKQIHPCFRGRQFKIALTSPFQEFLRRYNIT